MYCSLCEPDSFLFNNMFKNLTNIKGVTFYFIDIKKSLKPNSPQNPRK